MCVCVCVCVCACVFIQAVPPRSDILIMLLWRQTAQNQPKSWRCFVFRAMDVWTVQNQQHRRSIRTHCHAVKVSVREEWLSFNVCSKNKSKWDNHSLFRAQLQYSVFEFSTQVINMTKKMERLFKSFTSFTACLDPPVHRFGRWVQSGLSQWVDIMQVSSHTCGSAREETCVAGLVPVQHCHIFKGEASLPFPLCLLPSPLSVPRSWQPFTDQQESGQQRTRQIAPLLTNHGMDVLLCFSLVMIHQHHQSQVPAWRRVCLTSTDVWAAVINSLRTRHFFKSFCFKSTCLNT